MQAVLRVKLCLNLAVLGVLGLWASGCAGIKSRVLLEAWLRGMVSGTASLGLLLWKRGVHLRRSNGATRLLGERLTLGNREQ